jgi:precorrin-6Y C5,15-methyltransferase (decarboxylating)
LVRLSVHHADPVGGFHGWRPLMPVTQWHFIKSGMAQGISDGKR